MFRTILVPLDGSPFAEQALPYALSMAERAGASLELVNVYPPVTPLFTETPIHYEPGLNQAMLDQQTQYMERIEARLSETTTVPIVVKLLPNELGISETIAARAKEVEADLVVLTTHARGGLARVFLGSVADELIRLLPMPLLALRPTECEVDFGARPEFKDMLVPVDGTPESETVLAPATALAKVMEAKITLMRVIKPVLEHEPSHYTVGSISEEVERLMASIDEAHNKLKAEAEQYLEGLAKTLRDEGLEVENHIMIRSQPWTGILSHAQENANDLIALETHGRGGLTRLFLGSVTDKVIREATIPVLVHRPVPKK